MSDCAVTLSFLGAGSAFSRRYGTTCALLRTPHDQRWLVDCGRQAPEQLQEAGLSWHEIHAQLVTHAHGDHIYGLEEFAFRRYYQSDAGVPSIAAGGPRPRLLAHRAVLAELWESLAPSLRYINRGQPSRDGTLEDYFEVQAPSHQAGGPRRTQVFADSTLEVQARKVEHVPFKPCYGFEFSWTAGEARRHAWWSGDARVDPSMLLDLASRCTVLFHDCSFGTHGAGVHASFAELSVLPSELRHKMVLMHHDDDLPQHLERVRDAGFRIAQPGHTYDLETGQRIDVLPVRKAG